MKEKFLLLEFRLQEVDSAESADLVLSNEDNIFDFLAVGTKCLYKMIKESLPMEPTLKIYRKDFTEQYEIISGHLNNGDSSQFTLTNNSFFEVASTDIKVVSRLILNYDVRCDILGFQMRRQIPYHLSGLKEHYNEFLAEILPNEFSIYETTAAQELVWDLIEKAYY